MLVLGKKYKFTKFERLSFRKMGLHLHTIRYGGKDPKDVQSEIEYILKNYPIKLIVLNTKYKVSDELIKYLTNLQFEHKISFISLETLMERYLQKCYIPDTHTNLTYLENIKPFNTFQYVQKRMVDFLGVFCLTLLAFPIMIYSHFRIKKESPGESLFRQTRVGLDSKEFECVKFRSMSIDAEKDGVQFASENDPRVFRWGNAMRKTRVDELPQLLNVIKGDMHVIGPRPERAFWINQFEKQIPYYNERHLVRPGITGWAQVMYPYGENAKDAKQKLMYDLYYIKYWNIFFELKIVWKTAMVVLGKKGM